MKPYFNIAILASGSGSNAENIANYFASSDEINVEEILSNNKDAFVLERARNLGIKSSTFTREEFKSSHFPDRLQNVDFVILAGFLWLIPPALIAAFPNKIINIHPSLLPKFGGKGMYGSFVHEAVINSNEKKSGITVHLVNEKYDDGKILFQTSCDIDQDETPDTLAAKIHELEYAHFPKVIEEYILS